MLKKFFAGFFMLASICCFSQDDLLQSSLVKQPIKIDGIANEWHLPLPYFDGKSKLGFSFANDNNNLYMCFQTNDAASQAKILRAGMKITLITKNKHKASLLFPLQNHEPVQNEKGNDNRTDVKNNFLAQNTMMEVNGFATRNGVIPVTDSSGLHVAIDRDEANTLSYEIAIPQKELFGNDYTAADIAKNISLEIDINALERKNFAGGNGYSGGGRMGGRGGGRMGGGMQRGRNANRDESSQTGETGFDRNAMSEKQTLKVKFVLAQPDSK